MFKIFLLSCCFLIANSSIAQNKKSLKDDYILNVPANSWHLRFNLTHAIDGVEPAINIGAEYRVSERLAVANDVGYIYFSNYLPESKKANGFTIRPSLKYYASQNKRFYVEGELLLKSVFFTMNDWLGMDCVNEVPNYFEERDFKFRKNTYAFHAKIGRVGMLTKDNKVSIDYYCGIGVRYKKFNLIDIPANSCYNIPGFLGLGNAESDQAFLPSASLGVRLLFKL